MSEFYERYLYLCARHHKSPSAVANEVGLSSAAATGWKRGKEPSEVTIIKLANYFDVSVSYLTGEPETKNPATVRDEVKKAVSNYDLLNDENKAIIDQMIEKLIKSQSGD